MMSIALGILGAVLAVTVVGGVHRRVGPLETTFSAHLASTGRTDVVLAPLGTLRLGTHHGPLRLQVDVERLRLPQAQALLGDQAAVDRLPEEIERQSRDAIEALVKRCLFASFTGGVMLASLRRPHWRSALVGGLAGTIVVAGSFGVAASTWNDNALNEQRYTGLLALAPQAVGDVSDVSAKFSLYRSQLNTLVENVSRLYQTTESTTSPPVDSSTIRILHVSDMHLNPAGFDLTQQMVKQFHPAAIVDTGDINDWGTIFESSFADRIGKLGVPYVYVRGNHDSKETQASVAAQKNAIVLDDSATDLAGLHIWGIGDPRFTPDKAASGDIEKQRETARIFSSTVKERYLAATPASDLVIVHDPAIAMQLENLTPLVLAGHLHTEDVRQLGTTTMLIEGSTGGAGIRGVSDTNPVPLKCSMLYFDATSHHLVAYDQVTVQGLGGSGAQIQRHYMKNGVIETTTTSVTSTSIPPDASNG